MAERNSHRIVDSGGAGEGRIETLSVKLADEFEADGAGNVPMKVVAGEMPVCDPADVDGERRRHGMKELLGMVVGEDDPEIRLQLAQFAADLRRYVAHPVDVGPVLGGRQGKELGSMRKHRAADDSSDHGIFSPVPGPARPGRVAIAT